MLSAATNIITDLGSCLLFLKKLFGTMRRYPVSFRITCEQIVKVTEQSFGTTALAGFFVGAIMTIQFTLQVKEFGALGYLGGLATSGTIREVGPLLIAFMLSGKVGAFTSAELGTMRVTEQIDAIRCLGANPLSEIILPRFFGNRGFQLFSSFDWPFHVHLWGLLLGMLFSGISYEEYLRHIPTIVTGWSIVNGVIKCFVFAFVLAAICTYKGYTTTGGAKGVGRSVVQTAMATMVCIVIADWFTSFLSDVALTVFLGE